MSGNTGAWEMRRHEARGPRSLQLDLLDLWKRLGTLTPCLLILGVWLYCDPGAYRQILLSWFRSRFGVSPASTSSRLSPRSASNVLSHALTCVQSAQSRCGQLSEVPMGPFHSTIIRVKTTQKPGSKGQCEELQTTHYSGSMTVKTALSEVLQIAPLQALGLHSYRTMWI